jgi:tetratricopeptide (TPR) repeat protein
MTLDEPIALQDLTTQVLPELRFDAGGKLVCPIAPALSSGTGRKLSQRQLANFKAALYWLQDYQPPAEASNLERVRGLLEAFHHLSQLSAWQAANDLLHIPIPSSQLEQAEQLGRSLPLHEQLEVWGYYQELTDLYSTLLGKRDTASDCVSCERLGAMHTYRGRLIEARDFYQRALELVKQLSDPIAEAKALLGLADVSFRLDQFEIGILQAQTALSLARQQSAQRLLADCFRLLSHGYSDSYSTPRKSKLALSYAQEGIQLAQNLGDAGLQCRLLNQIGCVYLSLGKARKAIAHYEQGLALAEATDNLRQQWASLHNLGIVHHQLLKNREQGDSLLLSAIQISRQMQNFSCEAQTCKNQAVFNYNKRNFADAEISFQQTLRLTQQSGDAYQEYESLRTLGILLMRKKQFEQAKLYWDKAENLARSHRFHSISLSTVDLSNTSYLLSSLEDWRKGLRYGKKALAIARRLKGKEERVFALMATGYAYWQGKQRLRGLLIFLCCFPEAAQLMLRNESIRYGILTGFEVIINSILAALQRLWRFLQLQPRNQKTR